MSAKLHDFMNTHGIKHRWLAEKCDISTATLHHILRGHYLPNLITAFEIEKHTKFTVTMHDWVLEYQEAKKKEENAPRKFKGTKMSDY